MLHVWGYQEVMCSTLWEQRLQMNGHPTVYNETLGLRTEVDQRAAGPCFGGG